MLAAKLLALVFIFTGEFVAAAATAAYPRWRQT